MNFFIVIQQISHLSVRAPEAQNQQKVLEGKIVKIKDKS